jgi:hypothetical protein
MVYRITMFSASGREMLVATKRWYISNFGFVITEYVIGPSVSENVVI